MKVDIPKRLATINTFTSFRCDVEIDTQESKSEEEELDHEKVIEEYFKTPVFYLSTGTSLRLPLANNIRESEIALQIACQLTKL